MLQFLHKNWLFICPTRGTANKLSHLRIEEDAKNVAVSAQKLVVHMSH